MFFGLKASKETATMRIPALCWKPQVGITHCPELSGSYHKVARACIFRHLPGNVFADV